MGFQNILSYFNYITLVFLLQVFFEKFLQIPCLRFFYIVTKLFQSYVRCFVVLHIS